MTPDMTVDLSVQQYGDLYHLISTQARESAAGALSTTWFGDQFPRVWRVLVCRQVYGVRE